MIIEINKIYKDANGHKVQILTKHMADELFIGKNEEGDASLYYENGRNISPIDRCTDLQEEVYENSSLIIYEVNWWEGSNLRIKFFKHLVVAEKFICKLQEGKLCFQPPTIQEVDVW